MIIANMSIICNSNPNMTSANHKHCTKSNCVCTCHWEILPYDDNLILNEFAANFGYEFFRSTRTEELTQATNICNIIRQGFNNAGFSITREYVDNFAAAINSSIQERQFHSRDFYDLDK